MPDLREELKNIVSQQPWLMNALRAVREQNLPDWFIGAGAIRNTVWNSLHGFPSHKNQNDMDVVYFDSLDATAETDEQIKQNLLKKIPSIKWEVINQVRARTFDYGPNIRTYHSTCSSIAYWTETATCVGIRLEKDNTLAICAPHGLEDLFNLIVRPPQPPWQNIPSYEKRMHKKNWKNIWPKLKIEKIN